MFQCAFKGISRISSTRLSSLDTGPHGRGWLKCKHSRASGIKRKRAHANHVLAHVNFHPHTHPRRREQKTENVVENLCGETGQIKVTPNCAQLRPIGNLRRIALPGSACLPPDGDEGERQQHGPDDGALLLALLSFPLRVAFLRLCLAPCLQSHVGPLGFT